MAVIPDKGFLLLGQPFNSYRISLLVGFHNVFLSRSVLHARQAFCNVVRESRACRSEFFVDRTSLEDTRARGALNK